MRILLTPMAAYAETGGSMARIRTVAACALRRGHGVALCAGEDDNYRAVEGVRNYPAPIPSPFGLPRLIGRKVFRMAKRLGIQQRVRIDDFEQVLNYIGALGARHFSRDVACVEDAIADFRPDLVFAEHRLSPLVAARLAGIRSATIYSAPIHLSRSIARQGRYSRAVRRYCKTRSLPDLRSALDIYDWADLKFVPSSPELEPIEEKGIIYVGPLRERAGTHRDNKRTNIVAYVGNGSISGRTLVDVLTEALSGTAYNVFIATKEMKPFSRRKVRVAARFDFDALLPDALVFIGHGGQNGIMQSLAHHVPLILCPGKIFERRYNADSVARARAGIVLSPREFTAKKILDAIRLIEADPGYADRARALEERLSDFGGADAIVDRLESH